MGSDCNGSRWGLPTYEHCPAEMEKLNQFTDFYDEKSPYYGTKARARFLVKCGNTAAAAREQAARERKAKPVKEVVKKKPLPLAIINGEKIYGK